MQLKKPFFISPRLMAAIKVGDVTISAEQDTATSVKFFFDGEGIKHEEHITCQAGIKPGRLQFMFEDMICFLYAWCESLKSDGDSENKDLFPMSMSEWALQNEDELSMLAFDLSENDYISP